MTKCGAPLRNVENAFVNAGPVEDILRPAVSAARDNPKHVFQTERDSGPMVGFFTFGIDTTKPEPKTVRGNHRWPRPE
jgi:hypothetical protein